MKPALIATITLTVIICFAPRCQSKQGPADVAASVQDQNPSPITPLITSEQATANNQTGEDYPPNGNTPAQWILIIVTAITAAFICWQAWETKKAAKATRDSAKAALLNVQAAINTERPWLVVTAQHQIDNPPKKFSFRITNQGRTPARIIKQEVAGEFFPNPMGLPIPPVYHPDVIPLGLLVQGNSFAVFPVEPERWAIERGMKEQEIDGARMFLCVYGRVVYEDLISRGTESAVLRETRWCFVYLAQERRFSQSGPEEYNRYT